jgi:hypothetical protein
MIFHYGTLIDAFVFIGIKIDGLYLPVLWIRTRIRIRTKMSRIPKIAPNSIHF